MDRGWLGAVESDHRSVQAGAEGLRRPSGRRARPMLGHQRHCGEVGEIACDRGRASNEREARPVLRFGMGLPRDREHRSRDRGGRGDARRGDARRGDGRAGAQRRCRTSRRRARSVDPRLIALAVTTAALDRPANIRILLPSGYSTHPRRRYPVLYLLHGTSGGAAELDHDRRRRADHRRQSADRGDAGHRAGRRRRRRGARTGGTAARGGRPEWETFHIDQLIPWVDRNLPYRRRPWRTRDRRPIAGRLLLDELRRAPPGSVRDRGVVLGRSRHCLRRRRASARHAGHQRHGDRARPRRRELDIRAAAEPRRSTGSRTTPRRSPSTFATRT